MKYSCLKKAFFLFLTKRQLVIKQFFTNVLFSVATLFLFAGLGSVVIPDFAKYSEFDIWVWAIVLYSLAFIQLFTVVSLCVNKCPNIYKWSNTVMIIGGFTLVIVGSLFGFKYPPANWLMALLPMFGFLFSILGRYLNKTYLRELHSDGEDI